MITLKIIVWNISSTTDKIRLKKGEVFQSLSEFGSQKLSRSPDPDPDPCERIHAMMAGPGTNLEGKSWVTGTGWERCDCSATNGNRYDDSRSLQNPGHSPPLSFYLLASTHRRANERTS